MASRSALSGLTRRSRLAWRFSASISVSGCPWRTNARPASRNAARTARGNVAGSMRDTRCSHSRPRPRLRPIPARPAWRPGPGWPDGARPGQRRFHRTGGSAADAAARRRRLRRLRAVAGAQAGMAAQPVRQGRVRRIGPLQDLAQHALHLVDANGGIGLAGATAAMREPRPPRGPPWPDVGRESPGPASIAALGARTAITLSTEIAVVAAAVETGALAILAARPVLIGALAVAFIAPTGMALLATPVETAIAAVVPAYSGRPANGCRGCCSCIHHGDPAGDRHGPAPGGRPRAPPAYSRRAS